MMDYLLPKRIFFEGIHPLNILFIFFILTTIFILQILVYKPKHGDDFAYGLVRSQLMMCFLAIVIFEIENFFALGLRPGYPMIGGEMAPMWLLMKTWIDVICIYYIIPIAACMIATMIRYNSRFSLTALDVAGITSGILSIIFIHFIRDYLSNINLNLH